MGGGCLRGNGELGFFEVANLGGKLGGLQGLVGEVVGATEDVVGVAEERGDGLVVLDAELLLVKLSWSLP